ncbi:MAG: 5-(carboxyamino)imidazole ribonucleotide mutase [Bdellovibrionota bacterium]
MTTKKTKTKVKTNTKAQVAVIMGSLSDWETMKAACEILADFKIPFEKKVLSAHRTPDDMREFAMNARDNGIKVIIAGAGGAAHLPGMTASYTTLPVIGVPVKSKSLDGMDSLLSIVQMPKGVPVATVSIGNSANAGLLALQMLAIENLDIAKKLEKFRLDQSATVKKMRI